MAMDFFEAQEQARRKTVRLVLLFGLAIVVILALTDLVLFYGLGLERAVYGIGSGSAGKAAWGFAHFFWINLGVLLLILGGTAYKISALSGGGDAVA